ncbi:MAG: MerC domain-containing protein [Bacteroidota bacterium]
MNISIPSSKSDTVGALASGLCLLHCVATPFLFMAHASTTAAHHHHHGDTPVWWGMIDILFIVISLIAVYFSAKNSSKTWMKYALYAGWAAMSFVLINEKLELLHLAEAWIYPPALALIGLHFYNQKYCCEDEECAVPEKEKA